MIQLAPFILSLIIILINIFLCVTNISKKASINLNIFFWIITLASFFIVRDSFDDTGLPNLLVGFISLDKFSFSLCVILCVLTLIFLFSSKFSDDERYYKQEFIVLSNLATFGLMAMSLSTELILTLIFLEVASIALYALIAMDLSQKSVESAFKYFVLSSFMGAFYLLGTAFIFGTVGSTQYEKIAARLDSSYLALIGTILVLSMMFFKIAIFGFYRWSIDVYFGARTNLSGYLASAFKLASFAILIKFCFLYQTQNMAFLQNLFAILAILSMFVGNFLTIKEQNVKKILITASIVHSGYIFINLASVNFEISLYPAFFYLGTYAVVVAFAFAILNAVFRDQNVKICDLGGLYKTHPLESFALVAASLSFIGFPYTVGFLGKVFIFGSAVTSSATYLAILGIANTIISVYYYLKIITSIYFKNSTQKTTYSSLGAKILAVFAIAFIVLEGSGFMSIVSFLNLF